MTETIGPLAALIVGLLGSGHCLGMCGPIATLGVSGQSDRRLINVVIYNAGRLASYALVGVVFGFMGFALGQSLGAWSVVLRIALGLVLLFIGMKLIMPQLKAGPLGNVGRWFWSRVAPLARRLQPQRSRTHLFALGLLWGWLPCGLVYSMLALAATSGSALSGGMTMLVFGLGTLPAMMGMGLVGARLSQLKRPQMRRGFGVMLIIAGLWVSAMPLYHLTVPVDATHHHHMH